MAITIQRNDYVQPSEIREDVVQGICEAFLAKNCWHMFYPFADGAYRRATLYITRHKGNAKYTAFQHEPHDYEEGIKIRGVEMQKAFEVLRDNGYYIWCGYEFGTWKGYVVTSKPVCDLKGAYRVSEFTDFID